MSTGRKTEELDEARVVRDLQTIRDGALAAESWAPALRAVELLGRHIGMWRTEGRPQTSLAELIAEAAAPLPEERGR
ncbi:MAG: hypothetical protein JSR47_19655 [Proteobacteria bacterium]|nr:hypothetical protein [Pseudomonadota bacterium]